MKESLIDNFLREMKGEWEEGFETRYRPLLEGLLQLIDKGLKEEDTRHFISKNNRFVCEKFLRYILKDGMLGGDDKNRARWILSLILSEDITARDYDERIEALGIEHAVRTYWEPEDIENKRRIDVILDAIESGEGKVIIDVGCGVGTFTYRAALKGARAVGVDYSLGSVRVAKILLEKRPEKDLWVKFVVADATKLPFKCLSADTIISADFIEHIDDSQKDGFLDESERILKEKGSMIIFTPNKIRELIGTVVRWFKGGEGTRLHYGLTTRFAFEKKLRKRGFRYKRIFVDVVRPYLAKIPVLSEILALEILWDIKK